MLNYGGRTDEIMPTQSSRVELSSSQVMDCSKSSQSNFRSDYYEGTRHFHFMALQIGQVNNIPAMQFLSRISRNTQSKSYMLSLTECVWDFQNNALWDTH